jgi:hypothetical protein
MGLLRKANEGQDGADDPQSGAALHLLVGQMFRPSADECPHQKRGDKPEPVNHFSLLWWWSNLVGSNSSGVRSVIMFHSFLCIWVNMIAPNNIAKQ